MVHRILYLIQCGSVQIHCASINLKGPIAAAVELLDNDDPDVDDGIIEEEDEEEEV
jgi:hypothetical protein